MGLLQSIVHGNKLYNKTRQSFYCLLLASVFVTLFTLLGAEGYISDTKAKILIVTLGFFTTAVVAYIAYSNPIVRWQLLRKAQMQLISTIFIFRTRAGEYASKMADGDVLDQEADECLKYHLHDIKQSVLIAGDLKNTNFSQFTPRPPPL